MSQQVKIKKSPLLSYEEVCSRSLRTGRIEKQFAQLNFWSYSIQPPRE